MKRIVTYSLRIFLAIIPFYLLASWFLARLLTDANNQPVLYRNYFPNEKVQDWSLVTRDHQKISAWFIKKDTSKAIILLAGKGGNRLGMLSRAKFYLDRNYSVVLPDLRGTGNSKADFVTIGYKERFDLLACVDTLQKLHYTQIAAQGHSLGAATIAYSFKEFSDYSFVVLESCYDNIDHAFEHRMQRMHLPLWLMFPVKRFAEMRLGISSEELYPERYMSKINCPALFLCGDNEWQNPIRESKKLADNCAYPNKYFYVFKGAKHQDFLNYSPEEYRRELEKVVK